MPLTFDSRRLLPEGIHDATLEEVEREFALSDRRRRLFENLKDYLAGLRLTGWACQILVDGSFVMPSVLQPDDIDIILVLPTDWDMARRDFKPYEYNVLDKSHTRRAYKIEVYPVLPESDRYRSFFELFSRVRIEWPNDARKGIIRVKL